MHRNEQEANEVAEREEYLCRQLMSASEGDFIPCNGGWVLRRDGQRGDGRTGAGGKKRLRRRKRSPSKGTAERGDVIGEPKSPWMERHADGGRHERDDVAMAQGQERGPERTAGSPKTGMQADALPPLRPADEMTPWRRERER